MSVPVSDPMEGVGDRLRTARLSRGLTLAVASEMAGTSLNSLWRWENGVNRVQPLMLRGFAGLYGVPYWELAGIPSSDDPAPAPAVDPVSERVGVVVEALTDAVERMGISLDELFGIGVRGPAEARARVLPRAAVMPLMFRDVGPAGVVHLTAAAGSGAGAQDDAPLGRMWFGGDWLAERGIDLSSCQIISVAGDSMHPVVPDGSIALVDLASLDLRDGLVYAVQVPGGLVVKRVSLEGGSWVLVSDNPLWEPVPFEDDFRVVGRVRCVITAL